MIPYAPDLKTHARRLRRQMTESEQRLWSRLRRNQVLGARFYRQRPLARFIVDFYCPAARLVIEIDGSQHRAPEHLARDQRRDEILRRLGLEVLRFPSNRVLTSTDNVMEVIYEVVKERL